MKRICILFLVLFLILFTISGCSEEISDIRADTSQNSDAGDFSEILSENDQELIGVWCNYYELSMKEESGGTEYEFRNKVSSMFSYSKKIGVNAVFVQVRPFCDAFYKSEIFPWSEYITGQQGKSPGYDPLEIMVEEADKLELDIHAWINPYRVSYKTDISVLSENNPARKMYEEDKSSVYISSKGIFLNPANEKSKKLVVDGIKELMNYHIDGIHMDDYFYPDKDENIDKKEYDEYIKSGGMLSLDQWRRNQVSALVGAIYSQIKSADSNVVFGISPMGDIEKNYNNSYVDLQLWCTKGGYIDYIMPQLYYGFENASMPFENTAIEWKKLLGEAKKVKLYGGLAVYKCGNEDKYAGAESQNRDTGRYEWINNNDIISRQIDFLRKSDYDGFVFYSYKSIGDFSDNENLKTEIEKIIGIL